MTDNYNQEIPVSITNVTFVAGNPGEDWDFTKTFQHLAKHYDYPAQFTFDRKANVDYFYSVDEDTAFSMLIGNDKKGNLACPETLPLGRVTFARYNAVNLGDMTTYLKSTTLRAKLITRDNGAVEVGSRSSDWWYQCFATEDGNILELFSIRGKFAATARTWAIVTHDLVAIWEGLCYAFLNIEPSIDREIPAFYVAQTATKAQRHPADKLAAKCANHIIRHWRETDIDLTDDVIARLQSFVNNMKLKEQKLPEPDEFSLDVQPTLDKA